MASMSLDPSSALAEKYKGNRQILEQAVLGRSAEPIDPYSALRALQKLNVADRYEMMQKAMQGQPNPPSIAEQTVAQAAQAQAPQGGGLAAMPVPEDSFNMAGGGLVAFADGGGTDYEQELASTNYYIMPEDERKAFSERYMAGAQEYSKPDEYYGNIAKKIEEMQTAGPQELEQQKGLAALQAAAAMAQASDFARGLGAAGGAFGESYGAALKEANKEKRALTQMQMQMEDAKRKEALDLYKEGRTESRAEAELRNKAATFAQEKWKALMANEADYAKIAAARDAAGTKKDLSDFKWAYQKNFRNLYPQVAAKIAAETQGQNLSKEQIDSMIVTATSEQAINMASAQIKYDPARFSIAERERKAAAEKAGREAEEAERMKPENVGRPPAEVDARAKAAGDAARRRAGGVNPPSIYYPGAPDESSYDGGGSDEADYSSLFE